MSDQWEDAIEERVIVCHSQRCDQDHDDVGFMIDEITRARRIESAALKLYYASKQSDMDLCTEAADELFTAIEQNPRPK